MGGLVHSCHQLPSEVHWMNSIISKLGASINLTTAAVRRSGALTCTRAKRYDAAQLKENWLDSLTYPFPPPSPTITASLICPNTINDNNVTPCNTGPPSSSHPWVIGVDPDVSGAIALLKPSDDDATASSAQVFDSPHVTISIGKRARRRLDAKSIVHLLRSFDAPLGTAAYVEQSIPFPKDGKQGWWSGGFGYGLWIGVLVASGFSVVPVPSAVWKNEFRLCGTRSSKDDSRELASTLFPSLCSSLKRKKDHGRAEALLIAAYGKGLKLSTNLSGISEELLHHEKD